MGRKIGLMVPLLVLSACGGDGGGSATSGSTSGGSSTPTAAALATGELKPTADATYLAATMDLMSTGGVSEANGVITGGMTSARMTTLDTPMFSASYTAQTGYRLADALNSTVFGQAQLTFDSTSVNGNGTVLFSNNAEPVENYLAVYQATTYTSSVNGSGYTSARYGGIGGWQHTIVNGSSRQTRLDYFAYGSATPVGSMPHAGVVRYTLMAAGNYATNTDLWFISEVNGDIITVDFGAGTVTGNLSLSGENFFKSQVGGFGYLPLKGTISGNSIYGSITNGSLGAYGNVPAQFRILFVGPSANELIISYVANDGNQAAVGAAVGLIDPYNQ